MMGEEVAGFFVVVQNFIYHLSMYLYQLFSTRTSFVPFLSLIRHILSM